MNIKDSEGIKNIVTQTLLSLGFNPKEPNEMQADLIYLRKMRNKEDLINSKTSIFIISLLFSLMNLLCIKLIEMLFNNLIN